MKILVPIKRVVDPYAKVRVLAGGALDFGGAKFEINPFDEIAIEEAVRQREKGSSIEIVIVSIGRPECEEQLRKGLAMGADRAILVETSDDIDPAAVATELESIVRSEQPDLVLMGKQAIDDDCNQVGQRLAAKLGWPQATFASKLTLSPGKATVERETDTGAETLEFDLPGVVTTDLRLNEPRYIALPGIIKARNKPLEKRSPSRQHVPMSKVVAIEAPTARAPGKRVADVPQLVAELRARSVI